MEKRIYNLKKNTNKKLCLINISHSNYLIKTAGVERFIRDEINILQNEDISTLHIFPIIEVNKSKFIPLSECVGINFNNKFIGIYSLNSLISFINNFKQRNNLVFIGIELHHLHGWSFDKLSDLIISLDLGVKFYIHDYDTIGINYLTSDIDLSTINNERYQLFKNFISKIDLNIINIIFPSRNCYNNWLSVFPEYKTRSIIRDHLVLKGKFNFNKEISGKINIAFIGSTAEHKGFNEWMELSKNLKDTDYNFFYFGNSIQKMPNVKKIYVDFNPSTPLFMTNQLKENEIDIVFLYSKCQETYCYTYFEALIAGAFIITNKFSGNVYDCTRHFQNGLFIDSVNDGKELLSNSNLIKETISNFRIQNNIPSTFIANNDFQIEQYLDTEKKYPILQINSKRSTVVKYHILTFIYKLKMKKDGKNGK